MKEKLGITRGDFKVRKCIDDSGDCERATYDILNCFDWGSNLITSDIDNPKHARLFAVAPEMLEALINCLLFHEKYDVCPESITSVVSIKNVIEKASNKTWDEIKDLISK
jgi:hypothetical protein